MFYRILLRMGQDAWMLAAVLLGVMALIMAVFAIAEALAHLSGAETNAPHWVTVVGYIELAGIAAWGACKWFISAEKRTTKRNK